MATISLHIQQTSYLGKIVGLIGKKKPEPIMLKTRFGIHTFGVLHPIDVLILNKQNKVVVLKKSLKPFRLFFWSPLHDTVIELPEGTIQKKKLTIGDIVHFIIIDS